LNSQADQLTSNADLTMDQKLSIMAEISNVPVTEDSPETKDLAKTVFKELNSTDAEGGIIDNMEDKDKTALIGTTTQTMASLVVCYMPTIDGPLAQSMSDKVDDMLTSVSTKEGGTFVIPAALAALSGIADIGLSKQSESTFFAAMQQAMGKMTDMKLNEMLPGSAPYSINSPAIEMIISKNYADDYAKNKTYETKQGVNIDLPDVVGETLIKSMNMTPNGTVTFGASISATTFNPFTNIKNSTTISVGSLTNGSTQGFLPETVRRIYEDLGKGVLKDLVNMREQGMQLVQLSFRPFQQNNDATEQRLNTSARVTSLPPGKEAVFTIPAKQNMSEIVNKTVLVPLYYVPEKEIWSNDNCTLDEPNVNDTSLTLRCGHMGRGQIKNLNEGFSVTVDVVKDVFKVIKAGNYQQLTNVGALLEVTARSSTALGVGAGVLCLVISVVILLIKMDKSDLHRMRIKYLCKKFSKKAGPIQIGLLHSVMTFFSKLRSKGMGKMVKKGQKDIKPGDDIIATERKLTEAKDFTKMKKTNGFTRLNEDEKTELKDAYELYMQCTMCYDESEIETIIGQELEENKVLSRATQAYIDDIILYEEVTFWSLMKEEHQLLNAVMRPEITLPRPLKFLVFVIVLVGELFVTGYFHDADATKGIAEDPNLFITNSLIFSLAATVLMIPVKIIISVFMSGKGLTDEMTREEIERAEKTKPMFQMIGIILGIGLVIAFTYGIMMYMIAFNDIALTNWMGAFGISAFYEIFIVAQLKALFKVSIGILLMKLAKTKVMMTAAGVFAGKMVDWIMKIA